MVSPARRMVTVSTPSGSDGLAREVVASKRRTTSSRLRRWKPIVVRTRTGRPWARTAFLEGGPELLRDERVDEDERVGSLVRDRPDALGPVGGAVGRGAGHPLRMRRFPAPEARRELREPRYRWSSGGFWTLCSVAYSSTSLLITSAPSP